MDATVSDGVKNLFLRQTVLLNRCVLIKSIEQQLNLKNTGRVKRALHALHALQHETLPIARESFSS